MLDRPLIVLQAVVLVGVGPAVAVNGELEGALADVAPAHQLQHVVAEIGGRGLELEAKTGLVGRELQGTRGGAGKDGVDLVIEAHDGIGHVRVIEGIAGDPLAEPAHDRLGPLVELSGIANDGAALCAALRALASLHTKV